VLRCLERIAAARLARVEQSRPVPSAEVERSDAARGRAELFHEGDDRKRVPLAALGLDPAVDPPRPVRRVLELADRAFEPHGAGAAEHLGAAPFEVRAVGDGSARIGQEFGEGGLALDQRQRPEVLVVAEQEIEDIVGQPIRAAAGELGLQGAEIGYAVLVLNDDLAVEDQRVGRQVRQCVRHGPERRRPVMTAPCVHAH
jgi:hypothetical protein